jgi:RHS repeat-associated protein
MQYDALGRRVRKDVVPPGRGARITAYLWDGDDLAAESDTERGLRIFVHAPGTFVPLLQQERGEVFTYVNDHLGMPKELIDPAGMVAWSAAHSAWGKVVETRADAIGEQNRGRKVDSPFRLLGQVADEETGLCFTRFRCFDPEVGRWLSPDPLGFEGGWNLFGFDGSPTNHNDPFGLATGFFRGGSSVDPKPGEYKVKDGMVQPTHGVSVFSNPDKTAKWGTHEIESIPPELQIKQRGRDPEHYEIMPKAPMSEEEYKAKLKEVKLKKKEDSSRGSPHK